MIARIDVLESLRKGRQNMSNNSVINLDQGKYVMRIQALQKDSDEPSVMADYLSESAIVTNEEGSFFLTLMLMEQQVVTGFQVENKEAIEKQVNEETNNRFELFELEQLSTILSVRVQYEIEYEGQEIKGDEALRLSIDEESIAEAQ